MSKSTENPPFLDFQLRSRYSREYLDRYHDFHFRQTALSSKVRLRIKFLRFLEAHGILLILIKLTFSKTRSFKKRFILFYGLEGTQFNSMEKKSYQNLLEFLLEERFKLVGIEDSHILIEDKTRRNFAFTRFKNIDCCRNIELLMFSRLPSRRAKLDVIHLVIKRFLTTSPRRINSLANQNTLKSYLLTEPILLKSNLELLNYEFTTQSNLLQPPYSFFCSKVNPGLTRAMFWYSAHNSNLLSMEVPKEVSDNYLLENSYVDIHFVWSDDEKNRLSRSGQTSQVCGSIIFRPKKINSLINVPQIPCNRESHSLLIFDVTPRADANSSSIYTEENLVKFLKDILSACNEIGFNGNIDLKHKRVYARNNVRVTAYTDLVNTLVFENLISIIPENSDLYELSKNYCASISIPYTSTDLIMREHSVRSAYYWPIDPRNFSQSISPTNSIILKSSQELSNWLNLH